MVSVLRPGFSGLLDGARAGTALEVDRLNNMTELAGEPKAILRARHDWQRFQSSRPMYGQVFDWHTLEGPCVRKHDGRYYCFYSGGRWETENYGIDYAVADEVTGPYTRWQRRQGPRVLRTVAEANSSGRAITPLSSGRTAKRNTLSFMPGTEHEMRQMYTQPLVWTSMARDAAFTNTILTESERSKPDAGYGSGLRGRQRRAVTSKSIPAPSAPIRESRSTVLPISKF